MFKKLWLIMSFVILLSSASFAQHKVISSLKFWELVDLPDDSPLAYEIASIGETTGTKCRVSISKDFGTLTLTISEGTNQEKLVLHKAGGMHELGEITLDKKASTAGLDSKLLTGYIGHLKEVCDAVPSSACTYIKFILTAKTQLAKQ